MKNRFINILIALVIAITSISINGKVFAYNEFYSSNDILFYDQNATDCGPGGSVVSTLPTTVPEEYRTLFTRAAAQYGINPGQLITLYLSENYNTWKPFDTAWAESGAQAKGPMQFRPATWDAYKQDGDGDGVMDIKNIYDAVFSAAYKIQKEGGNVSTALGDINKPFVPGTILYMATLYNWGGGNMRSNGATESASLNVAPQATQNYLNNIYSLMTSNFTKGGGGLPDPIPSTSPTTDPSTSQTIIALDPGHGGANINETDPASGLITSESTDGASGEKVAMWSTVQIIKTKLEADGYKVILTKNSVDDPAGFVTKVSRVNQSGAAIAVSLHYTDGTFGVSNAHWGATPQAVDLFRENKSDRKRKTFTDANIAAKSLAYTTIMAETRTATGDTTKVSPLDASFPEDRAGLKSWGNISIVQLLSNVPWVYNETGTTGFDMQKYATGIINGIEKAVPATGGANIPCSDGAVSGNIIQTAINYAWPTFHPAPYLDMKPTYQAAVTAAVAAHKYVGGGEHPGIDCGGFVTRVMQDSGVDPNYNDGASNTEGQQSYMNRHPELYEKLTITSSADLNPGDIAINDRHTFLYVGVVPDFETKVASASYSSWRTPMAGNETLSDSNFSWYRHK